MKRYHRHVALVASLLAISACSAAVPPRTAEENQKVDQAMQRVKAEQDRTDQAAESKRSNAAGPEHQRSLDEAAVHPVLKSDFQPKHRPAAIHSPSGRDAGVR